MKKVLSVLLALLLTVSLLTACGGASEAPARPQEAPAADAMGDMEYVYTTDDGLYAESSSSTTALPVDRKLVKTIYLDAETKELDTLLTALDKKVAELGGYMEERSVNGSSNSTYKYRSANMVIRIPADKLDAFVEHVAEKSNITYSNQTVEDITLNYVATESRVAALETEQARLLELMESAETTADLLEIEARLTDVRYELENVASQLRLYDNQVDYATVHLDISQVIELTEPEPETFWERISSGFVDSLKGLWDFLVELVIFLIVASPYLVVFGGIAVGIIFLVKRCKKCKKVKKAKRNKKQEPFPVDDPPAEV